MAKKNIPFNRGMSDLPEIPPEGFATTIENMEFLSSDVLSIRKNMGTLAGFALSSGEEIIKIGNNVEVYESSYFPADAKSTASYYIPCLIKTSGTVKLRVYYLTSSNTWSYSYSGNSLSLPLDDIITYTSLVGSDYTLLYSRDKIIVTCPGLRPHYLRIYKENGIFKTSASFLGTLAPDAVPGIRWDYSTNDLQYSNGVGTGEEGHCIVQVCYTFVDPLGNESNPSPVLTFTAAQFLRPTTESTLGFERYWAKIVVSGLMAPSTFEGDLTDYTFNIYARFARTSEDMGFGAFKLYGSINATQTFDPYRLGKYGGNMFVISQVAQSILLSYDNFPAPIAEMITEQDGIIYLGKTSRNLNFLFPCDKYYEFKINNFGNGNIISGYYHLYIDFTNTSSVVYMDSSKLNLVWASTMWNLPDTTRFFLSDLVTPCPFNYYIPTDKSGMHVWINIPYLVQGESIIYFCMGCIVPTWATSSPVDSLVLLDSDYYDASTRLFRLTFKKYYGFPTNILLITDYQEHVAPINMARTELTQGVKSGLFYTTPKLRVPDRARDNDDAWEFVDCSAEVRDMGIYYNFLYDVTGAVPIKFGIKDAIVLNPVPASQTDNAGSRAIMQKEIGAQYDTHTFYGIFSFSSGNGAGRYTISGSRNATHGSPPRSERTILCANLSGGDVLFSLSVVVRNTVEDGDVEEIIFPLLTPIAAYKFVMFYYVSVLNDGNKKRVFLYAFNMDTLYYGEVAFTSESVQDFTVSSPYGGQYLQIFGNFTNDLLASDSPNGGCHSMFGWIGGLYAPSKDVAYNVLDHRPLMAVSQIGWSISLQASYNVIISEEKSNAIQKDDYSIYYSKKGEYAFPQTNSFKIPEILQAWLPGNNQLSGRIAYSNVMLLLTLTGRYVWDGNNLVKESNTGIYGNETLRRIRDRVYYCSTAGIYIVFNGQEKCLTQGIINFIPSLSYIGSVIYNGTSVQYAISDSSAALPYGWIFDTDNGIIVKFIAASGDALADKWNIAGAITDNQKLFVFNSGSNTALKLLYYPSAINTSALSKMVLNKDGYGFNVKGFDIFAEGSSTGTVVFTMNNAFLTSPVSETYTISTTTRERSYKSKRGFYGNILNIAITGLERIRAFILNIHEKEGKR